MITTYVYNIFNGVSQAYIYIWLSKQHKIIYVGMTNAYAGTIGRANGHFNERGTLRKRFLDSRGYDVEIVDDMILLSFPLPKKREFISEERSYREAVEYLVHKELLLKRGTVNPTFDLIAWVRDSPKRTQNSEIKRIAKTIVSQFLTEYNSL